MAADTGEAVPAWLPHVVFGLLSLFLFREFVVSNDMIFGTDVLALGYFARHMYAEVVRDLHTFPLWNPYIFGGLPFVDAMHGDIFYPTTVLKFVMPVHRAMGWKLVLHVFLAGAFTYGWLRHLKLARDIALFGGVAYMLAPVLVSLVYPGHDGKLFVTALTPLALWATDWAISQGRVWRFASLSLAVALLIFTAHTQLAYFTTWAMAVLAIFRLGQMRRGGGTWPEIARRFGGFALAGIVGALLIAAVQIWTPVRYLTQYSQRVAKTTEAEAETGYQYSTSYSLHPEEAFALIVPEFIGANLQTDEGVTNTYWGRNPFKLNHEYGGLIPLLLLPLAFFHRRRRGEAWLFLGLAVGTLIFALGATTPLFYLFYWLVPGVKLFRAPSSSMYIFALAVITAAALGLQGMRDQESAEGWADRSRRVTRYLWGVAAAFLALALLGSAGVLTDLWTAIVYPGITPAKASALEANLPNIQMGLWLTALLAAAVAGGWHLRARGLLPAVGWVGAVALLSVLDVLRVDPQFVQTINPARVYPRDDTTEYLLSQRDQADPFRVFTLPSAPYQPNHFAFYGLEELTGHHGNELGRYIELVDFQGGAASTDPFRVFRLLNTRYLVSDRPLQGPGLREAFRGRRSLVYELESAYPRAFLVSAVEVAPEASTLEALMRPGFDPSTRAIVPRAPAGDLTPGTRGSIRWVDRDINQQTLEVEASDAALLVVSDNHYPAWRAEIDGRGRADVLRVDHTLRAVRVPAGRSRVTFTFQSSLLRGAFWTSLLLGAGAAGVSLLGWRRHRRMRVGDNAAARAEA